VPCLAFVIAVDRGRRGGGQRALLRAADADVPLGELTRLGLLSVIPALRLSAGCLWLVLRAQERSSGGRRMG
jgi:hypothetical protein